MDFSNDFLENSQNVLVEHYEEDFDPTEEGKWYFAPLPCF